MRRPIAVRRLLWATGIVLGATGSTRAAVAQSGACPPGYYQLDDICALGGLPRAPFEGSPYMGASMGYTQGTIGDLGFAPDRQGWGVNVRTDIRLLSWLTASKGRGFVLWDLLYLDLDGLGKMTSDTLPYFGNPTNGWEDRNAFNFDFGYEVLAGMAFSKVAVFGGVRLDQYDYEVGSLVMDGKTMPLTARLVVRPGRRSMVLQGYYSVSGDNRMRGARLDIPFLGRTHLTGAYERITGTAESQLRSADLFGSGVVPATWKRMHVGVRVLSGAALGMF